MAQQCEEAKPITQQFFTTNGKPPGFVAVPDDPQLKPKHFLECFKLFANPPECHWLCPPGRTAVNCSITITSRNDDKSVGLAELRILDPTTIGYKARTPFNGMLTSFFYFSQQQHFKLTSFRFVLCLSLSLRLLDGGGLFGIGRHGQWFDADFYVTHQGPVEELNRQLGAAQARARGAAEQLRIASAALKAEIEGHWQYYSTKYYAEHPDPIDV